MMIPDIPITDLLPPYPLHWTTILHYLLLLGTADEVLAPADAFALYRGARTLLHPGADHGFAVLARHLPAALAHGGHALPPEWRPRSHKEPDDS